MKLLEIDFPYSGPWGDEMAAACAGLAQAIADAPGLIWKIWIENREAGNAGGIYLFTDEQSASEYLQVHTSRLKDLGIGEIRAKLFDVNAELSQATRANFCRPRSTHAQNLG